MPGRTRSAQPATGVRNIEIASTRVARSASARTSGFAAASSPDTIRSSIGSGSASSPSAAAAQPSATPRPFAVSGRWNAPLPGFPARPSSAASPAIMEPPFPPGAGPDQDRALSAADALAELVPDPREAAPGLADRTIDDLGARTARGLDPEVDDRGPLDDGIVAEDHDQLGVPDRGQREPERVERGADVLGHDRAVGAEAPAQELAQRVRLLHRLGAGERGDDARPGCTKHLLGLVERVVPRERLVAANSDLAARVDDAVAGAQVRESEAALVAEPALVDLRVVPGADPLDLALARRRLDVAADRAEPAHRRDVLDLPRASLEPVLRGRERSDRAELDHVPGERRPVRLILERGDDRLRSALAGDELVVFGDVRREAGAAVAEDAALAVEGDRRRDRDRLLERALRERVARDRRAPAEREVLERALAALVADRAVEWVVDEDELERRALAVGGQLRGLRGLDDHAVVRGQRAAGLQLGHALDLDEAHAARADGRSEPRLVAEDGNLDPGGERSLDETHALRHLNFSPVDGDGDDFRRTHVTTP